MLKGYGVELHNRSDDSVRNYEGVYMSTTSVHVGEGSRYVPYETLIEKGLFELYPELRVVTQRRNVRLHLTVTDLREYWFATERPLADEKVGVAARLAAAFSPVAAGDMKETLPMHLVAWFLALQKRSTEDPALSRCVDRRSVQEPVMVDQTEEDDPVIKVPTNKCSLHATISKPAKDVYRPYG